MLVDTSVAVPALLQAHDAHATARALVVDDRPGIAAHALLETYSILTRLPPALRVTPSVASAQLAIVFPDVVDLAAPARRRLLRALAGHGIGGGAVYDALVGLAAIGADRLLVTRDRRAVATYNALGVNLRFLE